MGTPSGLLPSKGQLQPEKTWGAKKRKNLAAGGKALLRSVSGHHRQGSKTMQKEKTAAGALRFSSELRCWPIQSLRNSLNLWIAQYLFCKCEKHANLLHSAIPIGQHLWEHRKQGKPMEIKIVLFGRAQNQPSENTEIVYLIWDLKMKQAF